MEEKWVYYEPVFECDQINPEMLTQSPWVGHRRFAYDFVRYFKPNVIVELGSYYGCSAFSFLQAIKDQHLETSFFAVDTWQGDNYTKNDYQEDIYSAYKTVQESCFNMLHCRMLRMTFDCACANFRDGEIELLHIDGSHSYEDVKHDYELWKKKVSPLGVIFFHDVAEDLLFGETMGSHIFWEELKAQEQFTLEMPFSNGLGVLFFSEEQYRRVKNAVDLSVYQRYINLQDTVNKDTLRKAFFSIRDLHSYVDDLRSQIDVLNCHLDQYKEDTAAKAAYIACLEREKSALQQDAENAVQANGQMIAEANRLRGEVEQYCATVKGKDQYISELEHQREDLLFFASQKESYAQELEQQVSELNAFAKSKDDYASELKAQCKKLEEFAAEKESYIEELEHQKSEHIANERKLDANRIAAAGFAEQKEAYAKKIAEEKRTLEAFISQKQQYIEKLEGQIASLNEYAAGKEHYAAELEGQVASLNEFAAGKEHYAAELEGQVASLNEYVIKKERYIAELETKLASCVDETKRLWREIKQNKTITELQKREIEELEAQNAVAQSTLACLQEKNQQLSMEKENAEQLYAALCQRVSQIPFGKLLLKRMTEAVER